MHVLRWLTHWTCVATLAAACGLVIAWLLGRVLTDQYVWSQYLWWFPTPIVLAALVLLLVFAWALRRASDRLLADSPRKPARSGLGVMLGCGWVAALVVLVVFLIGEVRLHRAFLSDRSTQGEPTMRIAAWNISVTRMPDLHERIGAMRPDLMLVANPPYFTPLEPSRLTVGDEASLIVAGRIGAISRYPVRHYAWVKLNIEGARPKTVTWAQGSVVLVDRGEALLLLLDTSQWNGSDLCVWLVDLPSDPIIPRERMLRAASEEMSSFAGVVYTRQPDGLYTPGPASEELLARMRAPDVVVGDMNTPRGSRSLRWLGTDMRHAASDAGWGWRRTWPRSGPLWAIDNMLLGGGVRAVAYDVRDAGGHQHMVQQAELVPVKKTR